MWGDVVSIGMRSTQILTRNNRMVIVPNSEIGEEQIVNYTYPDPTYRHPSEISVAFDNDVKMVSQLLMETVRGVDGVMAEREIEVKLIPDNY
jgi:small-conductance mechanosensitive channel